MPATTPNARANKLRHLPFNLLWSAPYATAVFIASSQFFTFDQAAVITAFLYFSDVQNGVTEDYLPARIADLDRWAGVKPGEMGNDDLERIKNG